jgi:hypothetical protein
MRQHSGERRLLHTSCVFLQDRGVLRYRNSRMEFRISRLLNSSQGTRKTKVFERFRLLARHMMCRAAGNSSIQSFLLSACALCFTCTSAAQSATSRDAQIQEVGSAFETIFLHQIYNQMKATQEMWNQSEGSHFKKSNGERIFESMRDQVLLEKMSRQNPIGIKDLVVRQLEGKSGVPQGALLQ